MAITLAIDVPDLSVDEHAALRRQISSLCTEFSVVESDARGTRAIGVEALGVAAAVVSAICAIVSLTLQVTNQSRVEKLTPDLVESIISRVEQHLSTRMPTTLRGAIAQALVSHSRPLTLQFEAEGCKYRLRVHEADDFYLVKCKSVQGPRSDSSSE